MARLAVALLFVTVAIGAFAASPSPDRPSKEDWEKQQADEKAEADAAAAKEAKMAAVGKVVEMLESVRTKVLAEGEEEAATYNKFACFCKDKTKEKKEAIDHGSDQKASLTAHIEECQSDRETMDKLIKKLESEIEEAEKKMAKAKAERAATFEEYSVNEADLTKAITSLEDAIEALKAAKTSLIQEVSETVRTSLLLADAMGIGGKDERKVASIFLQAPDVPMENYKFQSGGVIATLETLQKKFTIQKNEIDEAEVKSVAKYDMYRQNKTNYVKAKNGKLEATKKSKSKKSEEIAEANSELSEVSAELLDDQQYLSELSEGCNIKARTWDQRTKVRQDELYVLTEVIGIIKGVVSEKTSAATVRLNQRAVSLKLAEAVSSNTDAMEAIEIGAEAADAEVSFLQRGSRNLLAAARGPVSSSLAEQAGRHSIADLLSRSGSELHSTLLTELALRIRGGADPFAKVKRLIQDLIEKLLQEAANEANQKGWCDKAQADAKQKRQNAAEEIEELNSQLANLEGTRDTLAEDLKLLAKEIDELKKAQREAEDLRKKEKAENEATVLEADAGLQAVSMAMDILDKFYKTAAKAKVSMAQGPFDDAPDAGFKNNEAYTGSQGAAGGIIGMLEVMKSDFERTIAETEAAEKEAEDEHLKFMTKTGISLAEKTESEKFKAKTLSETIDKLQKTKDDLAFESKALAGAIKELIELRPACVDTGMSYEERVARREDEIASLKKALCILKAYAEYGPDGLADAC